MSDTVTAPAHNRLEHFPVTFFAIAMGMSGLTLALHAFERAHALVDTLSTIALIATAAIFLVTLAFYAAKALIYPAALRAEWAHPVRLAFFPAISISILLIATAMLGHNLAIARGLWLVGAGLQIVLTIAVVSSWIGTRSFLHGTLSPAWFIPAVGNVIAPIAGAQLGYVELSWYFMSIGLVFYIVLLTLVMNRLIFHDPLPGKLQPTLVILIAPPAVAFVAWVTLMGDVDALARILLNTAYFFVLVVSLQMPKILRLPFALSIWALSFPIAAATIASFRFTALMDSAAHLWIGRALMAVLVVVIAALVWRTLRAIRAGAVCVPE